MLCDWSRLSAGGPFLVGGLLMLASRTFLGLVDESRLYVDEYQYPIELLRSTNQKRIRDTLRLNSTVLTRFRRGSPGWVFRQNVQELSVLAATFQRWAQLSSTADGHDSPRSPQLVLAWSVFDRNGTGLVGSTELQRVMGKDGMGSGCNNEAFCEMVRIVSSTDSITIQDFCRMMCD